MTPYSLASCQNQEFSRGSIPRRSRGSTCLKPTAEITAEQGQAAGQAAIGVVLKDHEYRDVDEVSKPIGWARNHHEAEYKALIAGLELARHHRVDRIRVFSDSALVVNTVNGDWNLQPKNLKDLCLKAGLLVKEFADIQRFDGSLRPQRAY